MWEKDFKMCVIDERKFYSPSEHTGVDNYIGKFIVLEFSPFV